MPRRIRTLDCEQLQTFLTASPQARNPGCSVLRKTGDGLGLSPVLVHTRRFAVHVRSRAPKPLWSMELEPSLVNLFHIQRDTL